MRNNTESCPICSLSSEVFRVFARKGPWKYLECRHCGAVFLSPIPSEGALRDYYNNAYAVPARAYERGVAKNAQQILEALATKSPEKGKLLEVGCSHGFFLKAAEKGGWKVIGIELDDRAASYGRNELQINILSGTLESALPKLEPPYDAIVTFHVIEHLQDPVTFFKRCRELLRDGGTLILKTPNVASWIAQRTGAHWGWLSPPAHIHLFSPRSLGQALKEGGLKVERICSRRGDATNNLFELVCAIKRQIASRRDITEEYGRSSKSDRWQVKIARLTSECIYWPAGLLLDPWLARKGLQPELLAVARV